MPRPTVDLSPQLRQIREDVYGEHGAPVLAEALGIPARTWVNYEAGVTVPGPLLLEFIELTGANPRWMLTGQGGQYLDAPDDRTTSR
jgi:hypothetical protein